MRGFKLKIDWQRKILESVNAGLPFSQQLPGLTQEVVAAWTHTRGSELGEGLQSMIVRASELTGSLNDFSTPVDVPFKDAEEELERLCVAIRQVRGARIQP